MGRLERVNESLKRSISQMIQEEFQDPRLMFVTITKVHVSPDLRIAKVSYSYLGNDAEKKAMGEVLDKLSGYIRRLVGQRIRLRYTPQVEFVYDQSIEYSARIEKTFKEIHDQKASEETQGKA